MVKPSPPVVAIAGFQHETNSFSPVRAELASFLGATNWPALTEGQEIIGVFRDLNIAIGGFVDEAARQGFAIEPLIWANATPSGPVSRQAFETITGKIVAGVQRTTNLAAVYLDLHGAMVADGYPDAESEILRRVRVVVGDRIPIVASLDLHANVSREMQDCADALISCRTYPHVDLAQTGRRAALVLRSLLQRAGPDGPITAKQFWKAGFLIPTQVQATTLEPGRELYEMAAAIERKYDLLDVSLTMGFGLADTPVAGPAICATGYVQSDVDAAVSELSALFDAARPKFGQPVYPGADAIALARKLHRSGRPVVLADLQDNPGAGGTGDTTGLLNAMADARLDRAVLAVLYDPAAAATAHALGTGASTRMALGGHVGGPGSTPFVANVTIEQLGSGQFAGTGPMYRGNPMNYGAMALLRLEQGPLVIVGSVNTQAGDVSILRHLSIDPAAMDIIALKSGVHFRAAFEPLASAVLVVKEDGANPADYSRLPYRHVPDTLDRMP